MKTVQENHPPRNRRDFIQSAAAAGGYALAANVLSGKSASAQDELKVALIGAGMRGQALLNTCMKMEGIRIAAVCDIWESYNLQQASRLLTGYKQEHKTYADHRELLAGETGLDAVIVATPDFLHAQQAVDCLNAGLNVYCECPMAHTIEGAREMVRAAKASGKLLQTGAQRRSNPRYIYSFNHIINETKLLGKITAANGQWNRPVQTRRGWPRRAPVKDEILSAHGYSNMDAFRNWRWYKDFGGGPVAELAAHQLDVFNWFMGGPPKTILASGGTEYYDPETHQWSDTVMAILEYPNHERNVRALYQSINSNSNFGYFESFMGDEGTLYLSEAGGRAKVYREPTAPDWDKWVRIGYLQSLKKEPEAAPAGAVVTVQETVEPPSYGIPAEISDEPHQPHLANFLDAVRGAGALNYPPETAFQSLVTAAKVNEAIADKKTIELTPEDFAV